MNPKRCLNLLIVATVLTSLSVVAWRGSGPTAPPPLQGRELTDAAPEWTPPPRARRSTGFSARRVTSIVRSDHERIAVPMADHTPARQSEEVVAARLRVRAATIAAELGLAPDDEKAFFAVLVEEQSRREAALREWRRAPSQTAARERAQTILRAILAWKTERLRARFGPDRAATMMRR